MALAGEGRDESPSPFFIDEEKSLAQWRFELKTLPKKHWNKFYEHFLGTSITNYKIFFRALKLYGDMIVFEAVFFSARQSVEGDPMSYVLKVAHNLWKEEQKQLDSLHKDEEVAKEAIKISTKQNKELAAKIKKVKRSKI